MKLVAIIFDGETKIQQGSSWGGGGNSAYYVMGTCHFARKIGTRNFVNSGGF